MKNINLAVAVHIFFIKNGKVLLIKRRNTGFNDGKWSVPAGRLNSGETIREAVRREAKEEVNAIIDVSDLSVPLIMHHKDSRGERIYLFFQISNWAGELINNEPKSCSEIRWFKLNELPENFIEHVKVALGQIKKGIVYSEHGFR